MSPHLVKELQNENTGIVFIAVDCAGLNPCYSRINLDRKQEAPMHMTSFLIMSKTNSFTPVNFIFVTIISTFKKINYILQVLEIFRRYIQ